MTDFYNITEYTKPFISVAQLFVHNTVCTSGFSYLNHKKIYVFYIQVFLNSVSSLLYVAIDSGKIC